MSLHRESERDEELVSSSSGGDQISPQEDDGEEGKVKLYDSSLECNALY